METKKRAVKLLENARLRQNTYYKRKLGLIKKCSELAILCNVEVVLILIKKKESKNKKEREKGRKQCEVFCSNETDSSVNVLIKEKRADMDLTMYTCNSLTEGKPVKKDNAKKESFSKSNTSLTKTHGDDQPFIPLSFIEQKETLNTSLNQECMRFENGNGNSSLIQEGTIPIPFHQPLRLLNTSRGQFTLINYNPNDFSSNSLLNSTPFFSPYGFSPYFSN